MNKKEKEELPVATTGYCHTPDLMGEQPEVTLTVYPDPKETEKNLEAMEGDQTPSPAEQKRLLQNDFRDYVSSLPRRMQRKYMPHRKFATQLETSLRLNRLAQIKAKAEK